jgi:hypothetical protein
MYPKCVTCGKAVKDFKSLKHSVKWEVGYEHSKCYIPRIASLIASQTQISVTFNLKE